MDLNYHWNSPHSHKKKYKELRSIRPLPFSEVHPGECHSVIMVCPIPSTILCTVRHFILSSMKHFHPCLFNDFHRSIWRIHTPCAPRRHPHHNTHIYYPFPVQFYSYTPWKVRVPKHWFKIINQRSGLTFVFIHSHSQSFILAHIFINFFLQTFNSSLSCPHSPLELVQLPTLIHELLSHHSVERNSSSRNLYCYRYWY